MIAGDASSLVRLEVRLGYVLVTGVIASAILLAAGLALWLWGTHMSAAGWLLNAGLIVLMSTPILRVIVSFGEYIVMREWFFVLVTVVVLMELTVTVLVALSRRG